MKLLMTTDTLGGVWNYALELSRALQPHGIHVALATMGAPLTQDQWTTIREIPNIEVFESSYKLEWMQDPWEDVTAAGRWLLDLAQQIQPDLVHLNNYAHGALDWNVPVLLVGHSCVLSWHESVRGQTAGPEWNRYRKEVMSGLHAADFVVAPTRAMLGTLDRLYGPLATRRAIWNGRPPLNGPTRGKKQSIFAAGRLWDEAKNIAALARVAPHLEWPVRVAGEVEHPDGGRTHLANVEALGRLSSEDMAREYSQAAIYVLPARYEPFGLTALEAALSGCALVLGDIPTLREIWSQAALFIPPDDEESLILAIRQLMADPLLCETYAMRAHARAIMLTADRMAAEYVGVYHDLLHRYLGQPVTEPTWWDRPLRHCLGKRRTRRSDREPLELSTKCDGSPLSPE